MSAKLIHHVQSTIAPNDHPYMNGAWTPNYDEYDATDMQVIGEIPRDIDGVYVRNTENPAHPALEGLYHPFDGDGMIHAVGFRDGKAFYRNRFVRTDGFLAEQEAGGPLWAGIAERPENSIRQDGWGARGRMKDGSSTDITVHNGVALSSFWQCGELYRLDPTTLETLGKSTWRSSWSPT